MSVNLACHIYITIVNSQKCPEPHNKKRRYFHYDDFLKNAPIFRKLFTRVMHQK